jgi:hypothetical protein
MNVLFKLSDKTYTLGSCRGGGVCGGCGGGGYPRLLICLYWQSYFPLNTFNYTRNPLKVHIEVESNSDESKFRLSRIKVLVPRCRKPYYLHSLSQIYLSKHVFYLRIKIGSQVKHPVIEFDIFTLGYFTCLFHNLSN